MSITTDWIHNTTPGDIIYDIETYPNAFTFTAVHADTGVEWVFEISDRVDETELFCHFLTKVSRLKCRLVGYNNVNFDYPIIHMIYHNQRLVTVSDIYDKAMSIIGSYDDKFAHMIWDKDRIIPQVDLCAIHHHEGKVSLKILEFNMRSERVMGLPFDVGLTLDSDQIDLLIEYNMYDVIQTLKFYRISLPDIKFREEMSTKYNKNFINHNGPKMGEDYVVMKLEEMSPGCCYRMVGGKKKKMQTVRNSVVLKDVIFPYIKFETPEFNRILEFFRSKTITETKGVFKKLNCTVRGVKFSFGTGGLHGSVSKAVIQSKDDYVIEEWDVNSYYPNLAVANKYYPEHLGVAFCDVVKDLYEERKTYAKGTKENLLIKLALNSVYGKSNSQYSAFYDMKYTMTTTVNGQLLLCMLAEALFKSEEVHVAQSNTDSIVIHYPKRLQGWVRSVMTWWEGLTGLVLGRDEYKRMWIRDVNAFLAEGIDGEIKAKNVYKHELMWDENFSQLVVAKVAQEVLLNGGDYQDMIRNWEDPLDFMLRTKLRRSDELHWGDEIVQNVTRYYVSTGGRPLDKVMPPTGKPGSYKRKSLVLESDYERISKEVGDEWDERIHTKNKSVHKTRHTSVHAGWTVQIANDVTKCDFTDINYEYYIQEVAKLVDVLKEEG